MKKIIVTSLIALVSLAMQAQEILMDEIKPVTPTIIPAHLDYRDALFDAKGRQLTEFQYFFVSTQTEQYLATPLQTCSERLSGAIDKNGKIIVPFNYLPIVEIRNKMARVKNATDESIQIIDLKNKILLKTGKYKDFALGANGKIIALDESNKMGIINKQGKVLIPFEYDGIHESFKDLDICIKEDKYGLVGKNNKTIVPFIYDEISNDRRYNIFWTKQRDKYGAINNKGKVIAKCEYLLPIIFNDHMGRIRTYFGFGYINKKGEHIIPDNYSNAEKFVDGLAVVTNNKNEVGIINKKGKTIIPFGKYTSLVTHPKGLIQASKDEKEGIINKKDKIIIPFEYQEAHPSENVFIVRQDGLFGCVNKKNELIIPIQYDDDMKFIQGFSPICKDQKYGIINKKGKLIVPIIYRHAYVLKNKRFAVCKRYDCEKDQWLDEY